jgi:hypothetical protein
LHCLSAYICKSTLHASEILAKSQDTPDRTASEG